MQPTDPEFLENALRKRSEGRGMGASEISAVRAMDKILVHPIRRPSAPEAVRPGDVNTEMLLGKDSLGPKGADISGLLLRIAALESQVSTLETLLSGFSRRSIDVCDGGVAKTMTIASTAPA